MQSGRTRDWGSLLVLGCALAYAAPLLASRYFPGLDLPWHGAAVAIMHEGGGERFLGYFEVESQFSSYLTLYLLLDALANVTGDVAIAMQLLIAGYIVAFVAGARRLLRSFGGDGGLAVLAAPAAYSVTLEFGFLGYALCFPLTFWLWARARDLEAATHPVRAAAAMFALTAAIALTHPFAAVVALAGVAVIALLHAPLPRAGLGLGAAAVGIVPAVMAAMMLAGDAGADTTPVAASGAGLWDKLQTQDFVSPIESVATVPVRLFGFIPDWACFVLGALGLLAALHGRQRSGAPSSDRILARRSAGYLLVALAAIYLVTPYTFYWPHHWYGAQPRLLPLIWVVALVVLRMRPGAPMRALHAPLAVSLAALLTLVGTSLLPFAREASDFRAVIEASEPEVKTLGLIDQPWARWREPPSPWRHAPAWLLAERGGYVSNLIFAAPASGNAGVIVPVRTRAHAPPRPASPPAGRAYWFDWEQHASGWDQFLIRDRDVDRRHDYFAGHAGEVALVIQQGRWRLYRRLR
ncbi:MAG TPA: hypothetical protein VML75_04670 [Kofleriaceae bacterium]|nr:hypothetical protein [Kofleriaceae bacterium]